MKRTWFSILTALALAAANQIPKKTGVDAILGEAIHHEEGEGNLAAAIAAYKKVLSQAGGNREAAAKALLGLGRCYEKQGSTEARAAYESIVRRYDDQKAAAAQARTRLAAMAAPALRTDVQLRQLTLPSDPSPWNVSADGRFLGATYYETGNAAVIDLATGKYKLLTNYGNWNNDNGFIDQGAISRDGKQYAFWHYKDGATDGTLRVVGTDGKAERVLYRTQFNTREKGIEWGMPNDWSPDGSHIVVQLERGAGNSLNTGVTDFVLIPAAGGTPRVVKTAEYSRRIRPRIGFSPDGKYLAYDYPRRKDITQNDIHVLSLDGGAETVIAESSANDRFFGWTPAGDILFLSARTSGQALFRVRVTAGRQAGEPEMLREELPGTPIGVSQSGSLYYSETKTAQNAHTAEIDFMTGNLVSQPRPVSDRHDSSSKTSWSADGKQLAWLTRPSGFRRFHFVIRNEADGSLRELLPQGNTGFGPRFTWQADGKSVLALGGLRGKQGLYRIDLGTGDMTLAVDGTNVMAWLPDQSSGGAVWTFGTGGDNRRSILRRHSLTGEENVVYTAPAAGETPRAITPSPDGANVAFIHPGGLQGQSELRIVPAGGGPARTLYAAPRGAGAVRLPSFVPNGLAWTPDGKRILMTVRTGSDSNEKSELWVVPAEGGQPLKVDYTSKHPIDSLAIHPDGRHIGFTVTERKWEYWVIDNLISRTR